MSSPSLAVDNCSRLAPYFSTGCISIRRVKSDLLKDEASKARSRGEDVGVGFRASPLFRAGSLGTVTSQKLEMEPTLDTRAQNPLIDEKMNRIMDKDRFQAWSKEDRMAILRCMHAEPDCDWLD